MKFFFSQSALNSILKINYTENLFFHEFYRELWIVDLLFGNVPLGCNKYQNI